LIHNDFWSTEPGAGISLDGATLHPQITGAEALRRELAFYRDFYRDFTLVIREIMPAHSTLRQEVAMFEADRFRGDVVVVTWDSSATHPTATFEDRGGHPRPLHISDKGVSVVRVVDSKVFAADKYWEAGNQTLAMVKSD
jgi:hypothetical protein